jgi:hypothetical protein
MQDGTLKLVRIVVVLAAVVAAGAIGTTAASATTTTDCQGQLSRLRADTMAAEGAFTNQKDLNGAVAKLDAAALKLSEGKNADAAAKVGDFQSLLSALPTAPKPKLDPSVADRLVAEAQGVVDCINAIDAT